MSILVNVVNQKMYVSSTMDGIVAGSQQFVKFRFNLSEEWDGLMTFAQFRQNGVAYNQYLDEENSAYLPPEIGVGTCTLMLYGSHNTTIGTTNYLTLKINENILVSDATSTDISESLYNQLVTKINALTSWNGQIVSDLEAEVRDLSSQLSRKAAQADLIKEIARAKSAEDANATQIALKANQSQVDELELKVTELANNEVVANLIEAAVEEEMAAYLASGALANLTIQDGSVTRKKVDQYVEASLDKADTAMQPNVYDPQGLKVDIYSYAQGRADMVAEDLDKVRQEIADAYVLTDTLKYGKLGDAVRGAVTLSRNYAQALLADYKAFTIEIVDALPEAGASQTFYLIPKDSGDGYDKYWYITDEQGNKTWDVFGGSSTVVVDELPTVGEVDVDYILKSSSGYLYYKYIDGFWQIIAGSLAYVAATLPDVSKGSEFTDYYIVNQDDGSYTHYRFINGAFHVIGGGSYTKDEVNEMVSYVQDDLNATKQNVEANATNLSALSSTMTKLQQDFNNLDVDGYTYYATYGTTAMISGEVKDNVYTLFQCKDGVEEVVSQFVIAGGGSGGAETNILYPNNVYHTSELPFGFSLVKNDSVEPDYVAYLIVDGYDGVEGSEGILLKQGTLLFKSGSDDGSYTILLLGSDASCRSIRYYNDTAYIYNGVTVDQTYDSASENAQSGKAVAEALLGMYDMKLIEEVTLEEDAILDRSMEPDGTPYNFRNLIMQFEIPIATESKSDLYVYAYDDEHANNAKLHAWIGKYGGETSIAYMTIGFYKQGQIGFSSYLKSNSQTTLSSVFKQSPVNTMNNNIRRIKSHTAIAAGVKIKIYGVR